MLFSFLINIFAYLQSESGMSDKLSDMEQDGLSTVLSANSLQGIYCLYYKIENEHCGKKVFLHEYFSFEHFAFSFSLESLFRMEFVT